MGLQPTGEDTPPDKEAEIVLVGAFRSPETSSRSLQKIPIQLGWSRELLTPLIFQVSFNQPPSNLNFTGSSPSPRTNRLERWLANSTRPIRMLMPP